MRQRLADGGLFLLRVSVALLMLSHGVQKLLDYETLTRTFPDPLGVGTEMSALLIVSVEVGCSVLLILGLFTRFAAASLLVAMLVAALVHHFFDPWMNKELPLLYAVVFASLVLTGAGSTSVDRWVANRMPKRRTEKAYMLDEPQPTPLAEEHRPFD